MVIIVIHNEFIDETYKINLWKILRSLIESSPKKVHCTYSTQDELGVLYMVLHKDSLGLDWCCVYNQLQKN